MGKDSAICMDIGGTFIKYALVDRYGKFSDLKKIKTDNRGNDSILKQVFYIIDEYLRDSGGRYIAGVCISSAGQVSHEKGRVLSATDNLLGWAGTNLKEVIEEKYKVVCHIDNDVKCAALGEMYFGNAKNIKDFVCITIGTGVGGAVVENGRLLRGNDGIACELGHIIIKAGGRKCNCGNRGCFEQYASVTALKKTVAERLGGNYLPADTGVEWLFDKYELDERLKIVIDRYTGYISDGITSLVHAINPQVFIIGGAVSSNELLMNNVIKKVYDKVMPVFKNDLKVLPALMGNNASLLGVSTYLFNRDL